MVYVVLALITAAVLLGRARGAVSGAFLWRRVLILPAVVSVRGALRGWRD